LVASGSVVRLKEPHGRRILLDVAVDGGKIQDS
jgi:hypothetical protein